MTADLSDRNIFITGAARGLGHAAAKHLARCGAVMGVADINAEGCEKTAAEIRQAGGTAFAYTGDFSDRATFLDAAAAFAGETGRIDAVVNNAVLLHYEKIEDVREEMLGKMIDIGLKAPFWGAQALLAHYDPERGGAIINYASPVAYRGIPTTAAYSAIKGALVALTQTLAAELGPRGVRVNALAPGSVPTPGAMNLVDQAEYERRAATIPLRRLGREDDNSYALAFLLSREASFITGEIMHVDGGIVASA